MKKNGELFMVSRLKNKFCLYASLFFLLLSLTGCAAVLGGVWIPDAEDAPEGTSRAKIRYVLKSRGIALVNGKAVLGGNGLPAYPSPYEKRSIGIPKTGSVGWRIAEIYIPANVENIISYQLVRDMCSLDGNFVPQKDQFYEAEMGIVSNSCYMRLFRVLPQKDGTALKIPINLKK